MLDAEIPERALAVYGHPDDPEIAAGGTLARWADAGTTIWVVVTTRGDRLFISLLGAAYIHLLWLAFFGKPLWAASALALVWAVLVFRHA